MLLDGETSDMARYALERIPGTSVNEALRSALRKANGKPKIGIINSLGQRRDRRAVRALSRLVVDSDKTVAIAAAAALGQIADSRATKALAEAKNKTSGKLQMVVLDSYLMCADKLVADGQKVQAMAIYNELRKEGMPGPIRTAAAAGLINAAKR
jgi:hypothetical protein